MFDLREPLFHEGQRVRALDDLVNDGTFPDAAPEALLASAGQRGVVVQVGQVTETNAPVYMVEFGPRLVVGCFEHEIEGAPS
jgi:nitrogen fixation protein NifZ